MKRLREFWVTRSLITVDEKIVDTYDVWLSEESAGIDAYNHGAEVIHVKEVIDEEKSE